MGKTSTGINDAGISVLGGANAGTLEVRRNIASAGSSTVGYISRGSSDGNILTFYKDTSAIGSIGVAGSNPFLANSNSRGISLGSNLVPCNSSGTAVDNLSDIGTSSARWNDIYLGGGAYLGGTGTANKLEDYEEGTHTATMSTASGSVTLTGGRDGMRYIKIGKQVTLTGEVTVSSVSSPVSPRLSLPFVIANHTNDRNMNFGGYVKTYSIAFNSDNQAVSYNGGTGNNYVSLSYSTDNGAFGDYTPQAGDTYFFSIVYFTN
jgi:hypothetical protein